MYARRYVQIEPRGGDWARDPVDCGCLDRDDLDDFLIDPEMSKIGFPVGSGRRAHFHQALHDTRIRHDTDLNSTLVITKPPSAEKAKHDEWKKQFITAQERIAKLDQRILRSLLEEDYDYLNNLRGAKRNSGGLPSTHTTHGNHPHIQIIDLT